MQSENQASYYWYFDKKVAVRFNLKSWLIKTDDVSESSVAQRLSRNASELKLIKPLNAEFARIDFDEPMEFTAERRQSETMIPSLTVGNDVDPVFMTGNIVLMPNEKTDIEDFCNLWRRNHK